MRGRHRKGRAPARRAGLRGRARAGGAWVSIECMRAHLLLLSAALLAGLLAACEDDPPATPGAGGSGGSAGSGTGGGGAGGDGGSSGGGSGGAPGGSGGSAGAGGSAGGGGTGGGGGLAIGLDDRPSNTTCLAGDPPGTGTVRLEPAYPALTFSAPVLVLQAPGDDDHVYVVEQEGRVLRFVASDDVASAEVVLDITDQVAYDGAEAGLLGMAFHPSFAENGQAFLSYNTRRDGLRSWITRVVSSDGGASFDPPPEEPVLDVRQPYSNHNGGMIAFGPDGFLYIGLGDGGSGGDPQGNGQNTQTLLGKMLRIDPDGGSPYAIPADNPFAGGEGGRPEIFAWGLRNPWRWSFDRQTGRLFAGDVGQQKVEEIDIIERGKNYGWNVKEGTLCYAPSTGCDGTGLTDPIHEYRRTDGYSVTGGYVYRGARLPELSGAYIFADYGTGKIWALREDDQGAWAAELLVDASFNVSSFGEMNDGELLAIDYGGGLWRLTAATPGGGPPELLSQTGCFDASGPAAGLIPYDVNVPFWSDGGDKQRWLALPDGTSASVSASGHVLLPAGSVLVKDFTRGGRRIETRLLSRRTDGSWAGVSYVWLPDGSDARLVTAGERLTLEDGEWIVPSTGECNFCHTAAAGRSLGLEIQQLNRLVAYPGGRTGHQLATLAHVGVLELEADPRTLPALPTREDAPLDQRARAWLHANCSMCHRPGGGARGFQDLRYEAADMRVCDEMPVTGSLGITDARIVAPGDPSRSVLSRRIHLRDGKYQMPPLASLLVDEVGVATIDGWITATTTCQ